MGILIAATLLFEAEDPCTIKATERVAAAGENRTLEPPVTRRTLDKLNPVGILSDIQLIAPKRWVAKERGCICEFL